jgi:hypothetical protein
MGAEQYHGPEAERGVEAHEKLKEQLDKHLEIGEALEKAAEKNGVENGEKAEAKARSEALEKAVSVERGSAEKKGKEASKAPAQRRHGVVSKKERDASYKKHMQAVQAELPPAKRAFSKFIHSPVIERTSEVVGSTVARPNAILAGAFVAFVAVLAVYLTARHFGYVLSGFETIGAFIIGWVVGLLYDFFKVMITGKKA